MQSNHITVSASILSADLCNLERDMKKALAAGCDYIHFDVMDGHFTKNLTYGLPVLAACRKALPDAFFDVHLMIDKPNDYIKHFADAGADSITFHYEAMTNVRETVDLIHKAGKKAGISVRPETPVSVLLSYLEIADMFLIMTVEPGFGGQPFNTKSTERIRFLSDEMKRRGVSVPIEVDGGINAATAPEVRTAGATVLVAGSYIFGAENMESAVKSLRC